MGYSVPSQYNIKHKVIATSTIKYRFQQFQLPSQMLLLSAGDIGMLPESKQLVKLRWYQPDDLPR